MPRKPKNKLKKVVIGETFTKTTTVKKKSTKRKSTKVKNSMKPNTISNIVRSERTTVCLYKSGGAIAKPNLDVSYTAFFAINSIWDPDFVPIGRNESVNGWTVLNSQYEKYFVDYCDVTFKIMAVSGQLEPMKCVMSAVGTGGTYTNTIYADDIAARPGAISGTVDVVGSKNSTLILKKRYYVADVYGVPRSKIKDNDTYSALMGSDPATIAYVALTLGNLDDQSITLSGVYVEVTMKFHTRLYFSKETITDN